MTCNPGMAVELPGSNVACATLTVRECLTVNGVDITGGGGGAVAHDATMVGDGSMLTPLSARSLLGDVTVAGGDVTVAAVSGAAVSVTADGSGASCVMESKFVDIGTGDGGGGRVSVTAGKTGFGSGQGAALDGLDEAGTLVSQVACQTAGPGQGSINMMAITSPGTWPMGNFALGPGNVQGIATDTAIGSGVSDLQPGFAEIRATNPAAVVVASVRCDASGVTIAQATELLGFFATLPVAQQADPGIATALNVVDIVNDLRAVLLAYGLLVPA